MPPPHGLPADHFPPRTIHRPTASSAAHHPITRPSDRPSTSSVARSRGANTASLVKVGGQLASIDDRVVVKVPLTREGIAAGSILSKDGARICMTACYNQQQAFVAAGLGVEYVAPYLGRIGGGFADSSPLQPTIEQRTNLRYRANAPSTHQPINPPTRPTQEGRRRGVRSNGRGHERTERKHKGLGGQHSVSNRART